MAFLGGGNDEYRIQAGELNQTHIGANFGIQYGGAVVYGSLGAVRLYPTHAELVIAGDPSNQIRAELTQDLFFSHHQIENQIVRSLEELNNRSL